MVFHQLQLISSAAIIFFEDGPPLPRSGIIHLQSQQQYQTKLGELQVIPKLFRQLQMSLSQLRMIQYLFCQLQIAHLNLVNYKACQPNKANYKWLHLFLSNYKWS